MEGEKGQAPKARKDKKKNTQTGLLMGQNTNVFSQLSATYLQSKPSATEDEANFVNSTQIIEYHDPNINRLIALLRKKADVTKAKAAAELREQLSKMSEQSLEQFMQTFSHLFMQTVINQQSKQVIDQFLTMINYILTNFKKIAIKQIATLFGPLLVINRSNNMNQIKIYSMLFNGTDQQIQEKAILLLLSKGVMKKFLVFCRVIVECEEGHKIGQQNFQRNCSCLLKVIKEFIRNFANISEKKEEIQQNFGRFILQISDIVSGKYAQQYFKVGGKAKGSFLQFYQALISQMPRHPQWKIDWENYAKIVCQNFLDKDNLVQQTLWRYCNKQFIKSSLEIQQTQPKQQGKQKQKYWILHKYLPKPDQKLLAAIKLGGQTLYKELSSYCTVFPYTTFEQTQSHKSFVNKIGFIRKLMQTILEQQDENEARIQCYFQLALYLIPALKTCLNSAADLDEKKQQQIKTLAVKAQKQIVNSLQDRFYKNPPTSRNSFTYNVPTYFCKLLSEVQPHFDFVFDQKQTFPLYCCLKNDDKNSDFVKHLEDKIYDSCKNDLNLTVQYLQNFPSKSIKLDMTDKNAKVEETAKIFLLSREAENTQNWFKPDWDIQKSLIIFDPRISLLDLKSFQQTNCYNFKPSNRGTIEQNIYIKQTHDSQRFEYFTRSLEDDDHVTLIPIMLPLVKDILLQRNVHSKIKFINKILELHEKNVNMLAKKQWIVGEASVLRLRVVSDLVGEGLRGLNVGENVDLQGEKINMELLNKFLDSYCLFILTTYNYKLQAESEQLLKQLPKLLPNPYLAQHIFASVRQSIKSAYQSFNKMPQKQMAEGQDKQRKNRLLRMLSFIKKLLWYALNKKKEEYYVILVQDVLDNSEWKNAEVRPDLWMLIQVILENVELGVLRKVADKIVQQYEKYSYFFNLLMCCQLILPLQRHPSTKKVIIQLQAQTLKAIKQTSNEQNNIKILTSLIHETTNKNSSMLLVYGVKNLLTNLLKNYQNIAVQKLQAYVVQCLEKQISGLRQSDDASFNRRCLLLINICSELPLLDLPNIDTNYEKLVQIVMQDQQGLKILGYLAILGTIWDSSVGIDKLTNEITSEIVKKYIKSLKQCTTQIQNDNGNFARFYGLTFFNSFVQAKSKEHLNQDWQFILSNLILRPIQQGSLLHGGLQSARYRALSRIFAACPAQLKNELIVKIPQQILKQIKFYKEVLDQIEDEQSSEKQNESSKHYENIVNMFIQFAEVLVRVTSNLSKDVKPDERLILELLQCPFPGIKKTSFILLKQMYNLNFVQKNPPASFLNYLRLDPEIVKRRLDPITANMISGHLYSWQALINRRGAVQQSSQQQNSLTLQDYLQAEQLHEPFLKNIFEILETQLEYSKNEQEYEISVEQLLEMDSIVSIEDDLNLFNKMFRLSIRTLFMFIENFPLFLRDFVDRNKKFRTVCERLLRNVISDAIFKQQIARIQMKEHQWKAAGNFEIYVVPKNKEIYAEYTHDVIRIGLRLLMKSNYPLTPILIEFGQGLKIEDGSRWALMLQTQLHNRNNTIINGILLWKDNIDKKLAGVEQCSICFDIVNSSGQLPKKGCKTCKKKFHSVCIMKWFSKSNKSECPLCKSQFL